MYRHLSFILFLIVLSLFLGCQGRTLLDKSDTRPSIQTNLIITSEPSKAQVEIDDEYLGVTPIRLGGTKVGIETGERRIVISTGDGYSLETVIEGSGSVSREPTKEYYSVFRQEDKLFIEEGKVKPHHVIFEVDQVELTVEADTGWSFYKWEGDVEGTENPILFAMDRDKRVRALFTYTVSGKVEDGLGIGIKGVGISFSGSHDLVTTGDDGEWSKEGLRGKVIVTPSKAGYEFTKESREVKGPSSEVHFTGTYTIGGRVTDEASKGIKGVLIAFSGGYLSVITGDDGTWNKSGLRGPVTVTPSKDGYEFIPESREVKGPSSEVNFTGTYTIGGRVTDEVSKGIKGVLIAFSGGYSSVITREDGTWIKSGLRGPVTVTPSKDGYGFTPGSREVNGPSTEVNFTGGYTISGRVIDEANAGIKGVLIAFSGGYLSVTTDNNGRWSKDGLSGSVTITPDHDGFDFTPLSKEITGPTSDFIFTGIKRPEAGYRTSHTIEGVKFYMRLAPAATFPTGTDDSGTATVDKAFWIAETQVTYELWYRVRHWALQNGYTMAEGREGSHGNDGQPPSSSRFEPVTMVSWLSSIVWCNAFSELMGYDPVYTYQGVVVRDSSKIVIGDDAVQENTNGFRLPTSHEWELAARYKGDDSSHGAIEQDGLYWTPGNYASGATGPAWSPIDEEATKEAAWYKDNASKTQNVGKKPPSGNALGLFDMSGNVKEWSFTKKGSSRIHRGGSWNASSLYLRVGYLMHLYPSPGISNNSFGLRLARNVDF